jgi:hypothetical protein
LPIKLGVNYYVWYQAGLGTLHWGGNCATPVPIKPQLGYYDSGDPAIIAQHIKWMKQATIDFAVVDHYGNPALSTDPSYPMIDSNARAFASAPEKFPFCIFLDGPAVNDLKNIDYIFDNFVTPFPGNYYKGLSGKPLICYYLAPKRYNDPRFEEIYINGPTAVRSYLDLVPGYDDHFVCGRTPTLINRSILEYSQRFVSNYTKYSDYFFITSFNEWGEGTALEPSAAWGTEYLDQTALLKALPPPDGGGGGLLTGVVALVALAAIGTIALGGSKKS